MFHSFGSIVQSKKKASTIHHDRVIRKTLPEEDESLIFLKNPRKLNVRTDVIMPVLETGSTQCSAAFLYH
jgi:hypothetical protein